MPHGPEHHLEHVEHAHHGASDSFDLRVAMTIAIIAAVLACVTMLSHRYHNKTLSLQIEANIHHTEATDQWNFFQAKNIRKHEYEAYLELMDVMAKEPSVAKHEKVAARWRKKLHEYEHELKELKHKAEDLDKEANEKMHASERTHHQGDGFDVAELAVELALILCSAAVLTKRRAFWYTGMGLAAAGVLIALVVPLVY